MRIALLVLLARVVYADATLVGPTPLSGWEEWRASEGSEQVTVYIQHDQRTLPLVVSAACWHSLPVLFNGGNNSTRPFDVADARKRAGFQFAVVERKGLRSFTSIDDIRAFDRCTEEQGGVRKEERARQL